MSWHGFEKAVAVVLAVVAANGCAKQHKQRIAMLEEVNSNLTDRLNFASTELEAVRTDSEELGFRLQDSLAQMEELRRELVSMPIPEEPAPGWTPVPGGAMITIEGNVLFSPGKVALRKEARRTLDAIVSTVEGEYSNKDILVIGHTDDDPIKKSGWLDNYQLSSERALAVVRYLKGQGVSPERLIGGGCGEYRPRVGNTSATNRAANRRVEILATEPLPRTARP